MRHLTSLLASAILLLATGCGSVSANATAGGIGGAAVGAGTGALIGGAITNGDVAASALLGGAIGIPVGILVGVALSEYDSEVQEDQLMAEYNANQDEINQRENELQQLRYEVLADRPIDDFATHPGGKEFHGSTLGSPL